MSNGYACKINCFAMENSLPCKEHQLHYACYDLSLRFVSASLNGKVLKSIFYQTLLAFEN